MENKSEFVGVLNELKYNNSCYSDVIDKQQEIIEIQDKIIEEYEHTLRFLNKVCLNTVKYERMLQEEKNEKYNFDLMDFAWSTNDCIVDMPNVRELKEKLKEIQ